MREESLVNLNFGNDIRWRGNLTCSPRCHPLVRKFFEILNKEHTLLKEISERSGINRSTFDGWRRSVNPGVVNMNAALNVMGYELYIRPIPKGKQ